MKSRVFIQPRLKKSLLLMGFVMPLFMVGCSQIPTYEKPKVELPTQWHSGLSNAVIAADMSEKQWWTQLTGDDVLYQLIEQGRQHNTDIRLAVIRLKQTRALFTQAKAGSYPEISSTAGASRINTSEKAAPLFQDQTYNDLSLGGLLSYELDIWGRVDATQKAALASLKATAANKEAVEISVTASIATAYLNLRALENSVLLAKETVTSREETLTLRKTQLSLGSITPLTVQQAEAELAAVEVSLFQLTEQRDLESHALGILLGESPKKLFENSQNQTGSEGGYKGLGKFEDHETLAVPMGLPSDILMRRPDIIAAEQNLQSANANIGVARASLFPSISLTGFLGLKSESLGDLFNGNALAWNTGASITAPIFDYGKRQADVEISKDEQEAMVIRYEDVVRRAFAETLDGLTQYHASLLQINSQQRQINALESSLNLAQKRFDAGYSSYLEVLDAQRELFNVQLSYVNTKLKHYNSLVNLYKAIGGSWSLAGTTPTKN